MRRTAWMPFAALAALLATFLAAAPTKASSFNTIEGLTSTIFQQDQSSFSGIGLRMRIRVPQLVEGFSVMPTIEYWRNQSTLKDFDVKATRKDATLGAMLRYDLKREGWQPYVGAGIAAHFLSNELDAPALGLQNESESLIKGGLAVLGGVRFGIAGRLSNLLELEHHYVPDHSQLKFNWGLSYDF